MEKPRSEIISQLAVLRVAAWSVKQASWPAAGEQAAEAMSPIGSTPNRLRRPAHLSRPAPSFRPTSWARPAGRQHPAPGRRNSSVSDANDFALHRENPITAPANVSTEPGTVHSQLPLLSRTV